jgi:hypothetical protein
MAQSVFSEVSTWEYTGPFARACLPKNRAVRRRERGRSWHASHSTENEVAKKAKPRGRGTGFGFLRRGESQEQRIFARLRTTARAGNAAKSSHRLEGSGVSLAVTRAKASKGWPEK